MSLNQSNSNTPKAKPSILFDENQIVDMKLMLPQYAGNRNEYFNFQDYLRILKRRKWILFVCVIITFVGSIIKQFFLLNYILT